MNTKFTIFAFVASARFSFVGNANVYNDWAQKNAVNLNSRSASEAMLIDFVPRNDEESLVWAHGRLKRALKNNLAVLPRPKVGLISSSEVLGYPYVDRYLTELDKKDISHYYILREDYTFQDLSGESITIPAGFIWDGASIPRNAWVYYPVLGLEAGNARYNSALSEGLIHDYMYRDPRRFSKDDADDLFYVNLVRCGNPDSITMYNVVVVAGGDAYQGHKKRQAQGLYDVFTTEFYSKNTAIYRSCRMSLKPEVFDCGSQCKKKDLSEEKVCHTDSVSVNKFKATDAGDADSENLTGEDDNGGVKGAVAKSDTDDVKDSTDKGMSPESVTVDTKDDGGVGVRGWCKCVNNDDDVIAVGFGGKTSKASYTDEEHELMRSRFKASRFHSYVYFICRQCGRCSTKGKIGGSGPLKNLCIFDFTLAEQFEDEKKKKVMSDSDYRQHNAMMIRVNQKLLAIPEGQIVIPGSCFCLKPDLITVGLATSDKFHVCRYCGWKWVSAKE